VLSVREIALLVDSGQVELASPIEAWITRFLERPGIEPAASRGSNRLPQLSSLSARASRSGGSASDLTKLLERLGREADCWHRGGCHGNRRDALGQFWAMCGEVEHFVDQLKAIPRLRPKRSEGLLSRGRSAITAPLLPRTPPPRR